MGFADKIMGRKPVTAKHAQKAAYENATITQMEIVAERQNKEELDRRIEEALDSGRQNDAVKYSNDASAAQARIAKLEDELGNYTGAGTCTIRGQMEKVEQNNGVLAAYFGQKAAESEGEEKVQYESFVDKFGRYQQQRNVGDAVSQQMSGSSRTQLTPTGNAYLAGIQARREARKKQAGDLGEKINKIAAEEANA